MSCDKRLYLHKEHDLHEHLITTQFPSIKPTQGQDVKVDLFGYVQLPRELEVVVDNTVFSNGSDNRETFKLADKKSEESFDSDKCKQNYMDTYFRKNYKCILPAKW